MRFAYADPPYLGCCALYGHVHVEPYGCWDDIDTHGDLIDDLTDQYPDGWALSASSPSLQAILPLCPDVRVAAWVKPFCAFKRGVRPCYAWERLSHRHRLPHVLRSLLAAVGLSHSGEGGFLT